MFQGQDYEDISGPRMEPGPRMDPGPGLKASFGQLPDERCLGLADSLLESLKASARFCEDGCADAARESGPGFLGDSHGYSTHK